MFKNLYKLDYFFSKNGCFTYHHLILLKPTDENFDFYFALKLRQYEGNLLLIEDFLTHHLINTFHNDIEKFTRHIKLTLRQYRDCMLSENVSITTSEWQKKQANKAPEKTNSTRSNNKQERKMQGDLNSFELKSLLDNSKYFQDNINIFTELFIRLKNEGFIHQDSLIDDFKSVFRKKNIPKNKRITWKGSNKELQWFVKYLVFDTKKVSDPKNDIWILTAKCFVKENGSDFTTDELRNASGKRKNRKELLESILTHL